MQLDNIQEAKLSLG